MGNLGLFTGFFGAAKATPTKVSSGKFIFKTISNGIIYYYTPVYPAKDSQTSDSSLPPSALPPGDPSPAEVSSSPLLSVSPSHTPVSSQNQPYSASTSRPLLLFFACLGAHLGAVAKYRDLYLDRGMDVLVIQSSVMHFLWPRWGLDYGLEILNILEEPPFSGRPLLVHASSIGGYTFTQILTHIAQAPNAHAEVARRVIGQIYDSLVVGTLEEMAIGLGKTLVPRLEGVVKTTAMLYFWLFKTHTADFYERGVQVFRNNPVTVPALFFSCENDALSDPAALEKMCDFWEERGMSVESRRWKESIHAAHMRCHPEEYISTLQRFLNSMPISSLKANK
ncbi:transmembrane protein 53-like [Brachyistius frenatus]|uniref:transmembrane protein 53-like n=1 Tax=Brachyistius frenatus TaxID=100188 RepID=UPI0037E98A41